MTTIFILGISGEFHVLQESESVQDLLTKLQNRTTTHHAALDDQLNLLGFFDPGNSWHCLANGNESIMIYTQQTENPAGKETTRCKTLSPRQLQILQHLSEGMTTKQIALRLKLHPNTVNLHIRELKVRLGAQTRAEFVGKAARFGLCSPPQRAP